jgi:hypothetical protein
MQKTRRSVLKAAAALAAAPGAAQPAKPVPRRTGTWRRLPTLLETGVLVVGGGPAGIAAAIAAARTGVQTLLIENHGFFGGVASWCLGMPINQVRPEGKPRSKIHELLIARLEAFGDQAINIGQHQLYCNVDYLKVAVLDALDEVGCKYLVHLRAVDALVERNRVTGAVVATKNGLAAIAAKAVVDCSGDADVAFFSGAGTLKDAGSLSPATLCLNVTNVSAAQVRQAQLRDIGTRARQKYPLIPAGWSMGPVAGGHSYFINHAGTRDLGQFDATDPFQFSEAECKSRRQAVQMIQAMRESGGESIRDIELIGTGPQIGVRETRRVKGVYVLTEDDAVSGRTFEDVVAWRSGYLDIGFVRFSKMKIHDVPYRSLLPEKMEGLLVAGRCISASHVAASAGKSMGNCMATGHAAGLAAALAVQSRVLPRDVKVARIQEALRADGVDLAMGGRTQENVSTDRRT